jgi:serine protease Do
VTLKARNAESNNEPISEKKNRSNSGSSSKSSMTFNSVGITVQNMSADELGQYKVDNGVMITDVKTLSNAYDQSLAPNLVITEVNGKKINSVEDLNKIIQDKKGKAILLKVVDNSGNSRLVGLEIPNE